MEAASPTQTTTLETETGTFFRWSIPVHSPTHLCFLVLWWQTLIPLTSPTAGCRVEAILLNIPGP